MLAKQLLALLAVAGISSAAATPQVPAPGALKMDFTVLRGPNKRDLAPFRKGGIEKREDPDGSATLQLTNEQSYYSCDLYIGSNGQENQVLVDTGSSDLWIMSKDVDCTLLLSLSSSKRDLFLLFRVVDVSKLPKKEGKDTRDDGESGDAGDLIPELELFEKRDDCQGFFCMSDIIIETINPYVSQQPAMFSTATATTTNAGSQGTAGSGSGSGSGGLNSCTSYGSFETADSDSFHLNSTAPSFSITYGDGTSALGFWGTDYVKFGDYNVSDVSFAVVNETDSTFGVLGIGLAGLETTYSLGGSDLYMYENFPLRLVSEGIIHKNVYSLYLNDLDSLTGSVLFGAVDHAKYSGELQTVPIVNIYSSYYSEPIRLDVVLDSIKFEGSSSNVSVLTSHIAALLDSGTTFTYLPTSILESFTDSLSATYVSSYGMYTVSCDYDSDSLYAIFSFSGAEIKVPLSDLIVKYSSTCYLGVLEQSSSSSSTSYAILGDNFLRSAYVVYDLEEYEVSIAQAKYTDDEDIEVITLAVPLAVKAADYSSTSLDNSSGTITGSSETLSSSSSNSKLSDAHRSSLSYSVGFALLGMLAFVLM